MRSLYEISGDLAALEELLTAEDGEIPAGAAGEALEKWFDEIGAERDQKIENYCRLIAEIQARQMAREAEAERLAELAQIDANAAHRLKSRLQAFFEAHGIKKLETASFKIAVQVNGGAIPLIIPEEWEREPAAAPEAFQRRVIQLDKEAIRTAIREGDETHGARLGERGAHLRIR